MLQSGDNSTSARAASQILLDSPTAEPALRYDKIAQAFATIIRQSEPRFAIGIFGGWGSGKTTLMNAIKADLRKDSRVPGKDQIISVDFNAWRFEREPQLLVPLLDTIRDALVEWSKRQDPGTQEKMRSIARRIGSVVRALATGLSVEVGVPGAVKVKYDAQSALRELPDHDDPDKPQSLYVAAFQELEQAFSEFIAGGVTRVVVFVDDLDRCLPENALDLLESIKLFFDLSGFIFVVGLDEDVVQRAIRAKFADGDEHLPAQDERSPNTAVLASQRLSREYVKKIFQVPYSLPVMVPDQLEELLAAMYREATLSGAQLGDLKKIHHYLKYVTVERRVNPREVKRFINAYIIQTLVRPELEADTVLALQALAFRHEWNSLYAAILTDSELFKELLKKFRSGEDSAFKDLAPELAALASSLAVYLRSEEAEPLVRDGTLEIYLSSLQTTRSAAPWSAEAYGQVNLLFREIQNAQSGDWSQLRAPLIATATRVVASLNQLLSGASTSEISTNLFALPRQISGMVSELTLITDDSDQCSKLLNSMRETVGRALEELQILRDPPP
jgi:hypothetical protein